MKTRKTWVLVSDGARARVLESDGSTTGLRPALNFDYAASHAPSRDFGSDRPGRGQGAGGPSGSTAQHAKSSKVDWHRYEKHLFAGQLADELEAAMRKSAFDDLVLVAPPKALGELRMALTADVKGHVIGELCKDLTHLSIHELGPHLEGTVQL